MAESLRNEIIVAGIGESDIGKVPKMTGIGLNAQACKRALDDAGLTLKDVDISSPHIRWPSHISCLEPLSPSI